MDQLKNYQFIFIFVNNGYEIQAGITLVYDFIVLVVDEVAHFGLTRDDQLINLSLSPLSTYFRNLCFYFCDMLVEYHLVSRDLPCLLIKKKQWIIIFKYFLYSHYQLSTHLVQSNLFLKYISIYYIAIWFI